MGLFEIRLSKGPFSSLFSLALSSCFSWALCLKVSDQSVLHQLVHAFGIQRCRNVWTEPAALLRFYSLFVWTLDSLGKGYHFLLSVSACWSMNHYPEAELHQFKRQLGRSCSFFFNGYNVSHNTFICCFCCLV